MRKAKKEAFIPEHHLAERREEAKLREREVVLLTVGDLRAALADLPDDMPLACAKGPFISVSFLFGQLAGVVMDLTDLDSKGTDRGKFYPDLKGRPHYTRSHGEPTSCFVLGRNT